MKTGKSNEFSPELKGVFPPTGGARYLTREQLKRDVNQDDNPI